MFRTIIKSFASKIEEAKLQRLYANNIIVKAGLEYRKQFIQAAIRHGHEAASPIALSMIDRFTLLMPNQYYGNPDKFIARMGNGRRKLRGKVPPLNEMQIDRLFNPFQNVVLSEVDGVPFINLYEYTTELGAEFYTAVLDANGIDRSAVATISVGWAETILYDWQGLALVAFFGAGQHKPSRPWRRPNAVFVLELMDVPKDVIDTGANRFERTLSGGFVAAPEAAHA